MIDAGIHFGHRASRWNPKMKPYIFGKRNLIHIINVKETFKGLLLAKRFLSRVVSQGKDVVIVGTKRQARKSVETHAERVGMHWVTDRWLGGTLTNFREIRKRVSRLDELEKLETGGMLDAYSKKEGAALRREMRKIQRNLGGIRRMTQLPGAMVVIDQQREIIAVREARKSGIPVVCLLDTDSDPDLVDIPIPGNDDAMRGIELVTKELCDAMNEGVQARAEVMTEQAADGGQEGQDQSRRRSGRVTTSQHWQAQQEAQRDGGEEQELPAGASDKQEAAGESEG
jgi:small subunit ribosomal protein S2